MLTPFTLALWLTAAGAQTSASAVDEPLDLGAISRIQTTFGSEHAKGYNVIAEIPGTDPALAAQVVLLGGHLDSWAAETGASDDGAGVIVALEAMRILTAAGVHPRRTIRVALWGGEEQGTYGSLGYVNTSPGHASLRLRSGGAAAASRLSGAGLSHSTAGLRHF